MSAYQVDWDSDEVQALVDKGICPICYEDVGNSSHYHCPRCGEVVGMMGDNCSEG